MTPSRRQAPAIIPAGSRAPSSAIDRARRQRAEHRAHAGAAVIRRAAVAPWSYNNIELGRFRLPRRGATWQSAAQRPSRRQGGPQLSTSRRLLAAASLVGLCAAGAGQRRRGQRLQRPALRHRRRSSTRHSPPTPASVNLIEGNADELVERIKAEGANSPADVLVTVDAGRLWRADQAGLFQPVDSAVLEERIPAEFRHPDGHWFGYTHPRAADRLRQGADRPVTGRRPTRTWRGRSSRARSASARGSNIYNLSLLGSMIEHHGEDAARDWAAGRGRQPRPPAGGRRHRPDQVASPAASAAWPSPTTTTMSG